MHHLKRKTEKMVLKRQMSATVIQSYFRMWHLRSRYLVLKAKKQALEEEVQEKKRIDALNAEKKKQEIIEQQKQTQNVSEELSETTINYDINHGTSVSLV